MTSLNGEEVVFSGSHSDAGGNFPGNNEAADVVRVGDFRVGSLKMMKFGCNCELFEIGYFHECVRICSETYSHFGEYVIGQGN